MTVQLADIAATLLRPAPDAESAEGLAWTLWIGDARRAIARRFPDLEALNQDDLDYVVREAVAAKADNPQGKQSEKVDDYSYSLAKASRDICITDEWWDLLTPTRQGSAYTIGVLSPLDVP